MKMFTSFDEKDFWQAIREKNKLHLKINTVSAIRNDPTFERGELDEVIKTLKEKIPDIFENEVRLDYEERLEPDKWDKRYFTKLTYWFQENFAESRITYIKKVGKVTYKDTAEQYAASMPMEKNTSEYREDKSLNPRETSENQKLPLIKIVVAVAALMLVVMLLLNVLEK